MQLKVFLHMVAYFTWCFFWFYVLIERNAEMPPRILQTHLSVDNVETTLYIMNNGRHAVRVRGWDFGSH